jgi:hypothetical protein
MGHSTAGSMYRGTGHVDIAIDVGHAIRWQPCGCLHRAEGL